MSALGHVPPEPPLKPPPEPVAGVLVSIGESQSGTLSLRDANCAAAKLAVPPASMAGLPVSPLTSVEVTKPTAGSSSVSSMYE